MKNLFKALLFFIVSFFLDCVLLYYITIPVGTLFKYFGVQFIVLLTFLNLLGAIYIYKYEQKWSIKKEKEKYMLKFENSESKRCLCCNKENNHIQEIKINRPFRNNENIISFAICDDCLIEMQGEIEKQLEFLDECENYRR
jgi:hypothetical protein